MSISEKRLTNHELSKLGRELNAAKIKVLNNAGFSNEEIGKVMGLSESTIRSILKSQEKESE